jgi:hypothetical protein
MALTRVNSKLLGGTFSSDTSGNLNIDSGTFYVDASNNRVGVGTTSPAYKLEVVGGTGIAANFIRDSAGQGANFTFNATANYLNFTSTSTGTAPKPAVIVADTYSTTLTLGTTSANSLIFNTNNAEKMRITSNGDVGIGSNNPTGIGSGYKNLVVAGGAGGNLDLSDSSGTVRATISTDNSGGNALFIDTRTSHPIIFRTTSNSTERVRITSGGDIGIGISSPSYKLDVNGTSRVSGLADFSNAINLTASTLNYIYFNDAITFARNGIGERMRIDSSGNIGVGVTPSPWSGIIRAIDINTFGAIVSSGNAMELYGNAYFSTGGNFIYKANGAASRIQLFNGGTQWFTSASGTAGGTVSFTQAMTLDASGNLGVGTTGPVGRVDVVSNATVAYVARALTSGANQTVDAFVAADSGYANFANAVFRANQYQFLTGTTERMRIDSAGNVLIGSTSTPAPTYGTAKLNISGGTGLILAGYGDAVGFGAVFEQSASAAGNNGWPLYFVNSAEAQVGGIRQKSASVEYWTASSGLGANLINSGVQFPATQVASADANTLDDYEEGSWTPTAFGGSSSGTTTYGTRAGRYTKIGNQVTASFFMQVTGMTGTGVLLIGGQPFTNGGSNSWTSGSCMTNGLDWPNGTTSVVLYLGVGAGYMEIYCSADNIGWGTCATDNSFEIIGTITYMV